MASFLARDSIAKPRKTQSKLIWPSGGRSAKVLMGKSDSQLVTEGSLCRRHSSAETVSTPRTCAHPRFPFPHTCARPRFPFSPNTHACASQVARRWQYFPEIFPEPLYLCLHSEQKRSQGRKQGQAQRLQHTSYTVHPRLRLISIVYSLFSGSSAAFIELLRHTVLHSRKYR